MIDAGGGLASDNEIVGNLIGTNPAGTAAVGNGQSGIDLIGRDRNGNRPGRRPVRAT